VKKFTHAWLAFMAIKRLEKTRLSDADRRYADSLVRWFKNHKDGVTQGAWYPDSVIKDMANSHVLKLAPSEEAENRFRRLPRTYLSYEYGRRSPFRNRSFMVEKDDNLPDRCESIAHSVIDNLKMQESEDKGSSVSPTDNHIALLLFMLSHYVADALDPADAHLYPMFRQVLLQSLGTIGLSCPLMRRSNFYLHSCFLLGPLRQRPASPGIEAAG